MAIIYSGFSFESANENRVQRWRPICDKLEAFTYAVTLDDAGEIADSDFSHRLNELLAKYEADDPQLEKSILPLIVGTWRGIVPGRTTSGKLIDKRDWRAFKHDGLSQMAEPSQTGLKYHGGKSPKTKKFVHWIHVTERKASEARGDAQTIDFTKDIEMEVDQRRKRVKSVNVVFTTTYSGKTQETKSLEAFFRAYLEP